MPSSGSGGQAAVQGQREHLSPEREKIHGTSCLVEDGGITFCLLCDVL